jgi:short subunit dehydrogenase-like uncharacterized protein
VLREGDVRGDRVRARPEPLAEHAEPLLGAIDERHARSLADEELGGRGADPARRPGHDRHLAFEPAHAPTSSNGRAKPRASPSASPPLHRAIAVERVAFVARAGIQSAMTSTGNRRFQLVLWGATGFTGRLVAAYLAEHAGPELRWALAGRSLEKLEAVRAELGASWPRARALPLLVAESNDRASLDALAREADVVCSTVGPFARYGSELVAACAALGTSYCDITGEAHFIRGTIDRHHEEARASGARIVHCCGFDSIPSDLGVLMLHDHARRAHGGRIDEASFVVKKMRGGFSGGTLASMLAIVDAAKRDPKVRRVLVDPYALAPEGERSGPEGRDRLLPSFDAEAQGFTAPFLMGPINTRVVRRTNAILGYPYGRGFRYRESMLFPKSPLGLLGATATSLGIGAFVPVAAFGPTRRLLDERLLAPGEGPSQEARERGFFDIAIHARGRTGDDRPMKLVGRVVGHADPGYGETAKMLGESALCLALDTLSTRGGVLTPASAMGMRLVERLREAGMTFEIVDGDPSPHPE